MSVPAWLKSVLAESSSLCLDSEVDRAKLADSIVAKLTELAPTIAACIASAARAHHATRGIGDAGDIAKQIGANGATSILMLLESE